MLEDVGAQWHPRVRDPGRLPTSVEEYRLGRLQPPPHQDHEVVQVRVRFMHPDVVLEFPGDSRHGLLVPWLRKGRPRALRRRSGSGEVVDRRAKAVAAAG